jgi:CHAT domain-containing protein/tetratricopeptide (TPR) repeat protein
LTDLTVSSAQFRGWSCPSCNGSTEILTWIIVDVLERPDLQALIADGSVHTATCAFCRTTINRPDPILVIRLSQNAPVILGIPEQADPQQMIEESEPLFQQARAALDRALRDVPGPVATASFETLSVAASRDLDRDLSGRPSTYGGQTGWLGETASSYQEFLDQVRELAEHRRTHQALNHLREVTTLDELTALMATFPEVAAPRAESEMIAWANRASGDEESHVAASQLRLVRALAAGDIANGWAEYERDMHHLWERYVGPRLDGLLAEFDQFKVLGDYASVARVGLEILEIARSGEIVDLECAISFDVSGALFHMEGDGRKERLESAIALLDRVIEMLDTHPELDGPVRRARILSSLGALFGARLEQDPDGNQDRAIALQREALDLVSMEDDGDTWAMAHTNLALALLVRSVGEGGDVEQAINHLQEALRWRRADRNILDWSFTQINLGIAHARVQSGNRRENILRAIEHAQSAAEGFSLAGAPNLEAQAFHNLGDGRLLLAQLEDTTDAERAELLDQAEKDARTSLTLRPLSEWPIDAGRTWSLLATMLEARGDRSEAVEAYQMSLQGLGPATAPRECRDAARSLAVLMTEQGDWDAAAEAWNKAAEATINAMESRATVRGRLDEIRSGHNLFRWAAYAHARAGQPERAIEILEIGRARELAAWLQRDLIDLDRLGHLSPSLRDRFGELRAELDQADRDYRSGIEAPPEPRLSVAAESLRQVIDQIRQLPGFEHFLDRPSFADTLAGINSGESIAYLITSPFGSSVLLVGIDNSAEPLVKAIHAERVTSTEIARQLFGLVDDTHATGGYVAAQIGLSEDLDLHLASLSDLIGQSLLKPLAEALASLKAQSVCLIPIALMNLIPLHALTWSDDGRTRCLLDDLEITFAPSALTRSVCQQRSKRRDGLKPMMLAVGNPLPHPNPLPEAQLEAELVCRAFPTDSSSLLVGERATKAAVVAELPKATHVHLACHGTASIMEDALTASLSFENNEHLSAREVVDLSGLSARLIVLAACSTAVIEGYETVDEVLSLATAFLATGAAGVIAALWPVDDHATALAMSRFYEILTGTNGSLAAVNPASALRETQLWLRELSVQEENDYLARRPFLRAQLRVSDARRSAIHPLSDTSQPYAQLSSWAAFQIHGA